MLKVISEWTGSMVQVPVVRPGGAAVSVMSLPDGYVPPPKHQSSRIDNTRHIERYITQDADLRKPSRTARAAPGPAGPRDRDKMIYE
ncbi:hypothetical protein GCM10023195_74990 [Actinoallomurus liliacearum]|uniref:Uncharacterized protein n=1 Tax=Actinoallomurus liliacearum TaxID=1080073 RepID=A0ABP8TV02_9ACTN